jgi:HNH endonuclease
MNKRLEALARERAGSRCEYCWMPEDLSLWPFEVDHIIPRKHGGPTSAENLALACAYCNGFKGPNLSGIDPVSGLVVRLYHPRKNRWRSHFEWDGPILIGLSRIGRATINVLVMNHPRSVYVREELIEAGLFP